MAWSSLHSPALPAREGGRRLASPAGSREKRPDARLRGRTRPRPSRCQARSGRVTVDGINRGARPRPPSAPADPTHDATPESPAMIRDFRSKFLALPLAAATLATWAAASAETPKAPAATRTGQDALGDWTTDAPGVRRKITVADLAPPFDTPSSKNQPEGRQAARWGLAQGTRRVQGRGVRHRPDQPPGHHDRPQRRHLRRREPGPPSQDPPRLRRRRQARDDGRLRRRAQPSLRHRLLPARAEPHPRLRRQHDLGRPLPLRQRRHQGDR